jgi:hypothetical protein
MICELMLYTLKEGQEPTTVDDLMRRARSLLLRIPQVMAIKSGKSVSAASSAEALTKTTQSDKADKTPRAAAESANFFVSVEYDSLAKRELVHDDPLWMKYQLEVVQPHVQQTQTLIYELEPGKNIKYS